VCTAAVRISDKQLGASFAENAYMARPLRFIPSNSLVEITTRTLQGRLLLKPSPELNDALLGVIGKAQDLYKMILHAFVILSNHAHFLLSPSSAQQLAAFMRFVNANMAKEAARLHDWPERVWSRRYRSICVIDEQAAHARMRYILAHGAKEGLVASAASWPGPNCVAALTTGALLRGTWFDRSAEYRARAAGKQVSPGEYATSFDVRLTPLPCLKHLDSDQRQAHFRRVVREIDVAAEAANKANNRTPMGVDKILAQDPHHRPVAPDRSPAPLVHAHDQEGRRAFHAAYREFVTNFRVGVANLIANAKEISKLFPDCAFPPALPFKTAIASPAAAAA
jgi:REP element-mobilizing transposase RayT